MTTNDDERHPLYAAAIAADEAFQSHLVRVFGTWRAADMRYQPAKWPADEGLKAAAATKHKADLAWYRYMSGEA